MPRTVFECADCDGTGFEREKKGEILEGLKGKLAYDGAAVMVTHAQLTDVIEEIETLREAVATERERWSDLEDQSAMLVAFFSSAIKGGEAWSPICEKEHSKWLTLHAAIRAEPEPQPEKEA